MEITDTRENPPRVPLAPEGQLMAALEDSARTGMSKAVVIRADQVRALRKQLGQVKVRDRWQVFTGTRNEDGGMVRFLFRAVPRHSS